MGRIRRHLTFANVASAIALFVALGGGTAVALNGADTVQSDDLGPGAQVKGPDVAANAVNGTDVVDNSITGADLAASALPRGRATTSSCDPTSTAFVNCGSVILNLTRESRVLMVASGMWHGAGGQTSGKCHLRVDASSFGPNALPGEVTSTTNASANEDVTLTSVTAPLEAGTHLFGLSCNQEQGQMTYDRTFLSVVVIGPVI
jgi:uncharacterized delta-60 repeat protein